MDKGALRFAATPFESPALLRAYIPATSSGVLRSRDKTFISRDTYVEGSVAEGAAIYADKMREHQITEPMNYGVQSEEDLNEGLTLLNQARIPDKTLSAHMDWQNRMHESEVQFVNDKIGEKDGSKGSALAVLNGIRGAQKSIVIENPYVVLTDEMKKALKDAHLRNVSITVITNSTGSTDSGVVAGAWVESRDFLKSIGATVYEVNESKVSGLDKLKNMLRFPKSKASLHSKAMIIDDETSYIMSFNMDPRSQNTNSETVQVIKSRSFARELNTAINHTINTQTRLAVTNGKLMALASKCSFIMRGLARLLKPHL